MQNLLIFKFCGTCFIIEFTTERFQVCEVVPNMAYVKRKIQASIEHLHQRSVTGITRIIIFLITVHKDTQQDTGCDRRDVRKRVTKELAGCNCRAKH